MANLNIEVNKVIENYRFIYPMVDIQKEVLFGGDIRPVEESNISREDGQSSSSSESLKYLLVTIGVILLALLLFFSYKKFIRRWLRSRKQGLSEQGSSSLKYTEFASMRDWAYTTIKFVSNLYRHFIIWIFIEFASVYWIKDALLKHYLLIIPHYDVY